ncbi:hypothetical protein COBT_002977 [Conglomerata obtusa]
MTQDLDRGASTTKLAAINFDWSIISAKTIYKCMTPYLTNINSLEAVRIYRTPFGQKRLEEEERSGPQVKSSTKVTENDRSAHENNPNDELTTIDKNKKQEISSKTDNNETENAKNLSDTKTQKRDRRKFEQQKTIDPNIYKYKQDRKKYLIAFAYFTDVSEAENVYNCLDGLEIENTGNYFDLRFVENYEVCDLVEICSKDEEYEPVYKRSKEDDIEWEHDIMREGYIDSLFLKDEIDSDLVNNLIDLSGEENDIQSYESINNVDKTIPDIKNKSNKNKFDEHNLKKSKNLNVNENVKNNNLLLEENDDNYKKNKTEDIRNKVDKNNEVPNKKENRKNNKDIEENETKKDEKEKYRKKNKKASKFDLEQFVEEKDDNNFNINLNDERFKDVLKDEDFNIDVTHHLYKNSESLKKIMKEKRKNHKNTE